MIFHPHVNVAAALLLAGAVGVDASRAREEMRTEAFSASASKAPAYLRSRQSDVGRARFPGIARSGFGFGYGFFPPLFQRPLVSGFWYERPYPYHFDYYRWRWGPRTTSPLAEDPCAEPVPPLAPP